MLICWVAFPLLLALVCAGLGALLERAAARELTLGVRLPCGLALLIALMDAATRSGATAPAAVPLVLVLAGCGLVLRARRPVARRVGAAAPAPGGGGTGEEGATGGEPPPDDGASARRWAGWLAAPAVFAVYAAPIVLSGQATWAGYIKLDDTSTWLALVDRALEHGRSIAGLAPSTYQQALAHYLTVGYPIGSFLPVGLGHAVLGTDTAWLTDPWMAFLAAMLALALTRLARGAGAGAWAGAAIAFVAAQPALLYGYYLWGGMKEMAAAALIAAFAVAVVPALRRPLRPRALIGPLVVAWALVAASSSGGLVWIGPGALIAAVLLLAPPNGVRVQPPRWAWVTGVAAVAVGCALVLRPDSFVRRFRAVLGGVHELGNLLRPLSPWQIAGIWPAGDFRYAPAHATLTDALIALAVVGAAACAVVIVRRHRAAPTVYLACTLTGAGLIGGLASPWLAAKAFATASPAIPFAALTAAALLVGSGRTRAWARWTRPLGAAFSVVVAIAVLWGNALAYHGVSLAPRQQFAELQAIGGRIAGQGPTLMTEYQPYGARHFLRDAAPESASELRTRLDPLLDGEPLPKGGAADVDQFQLQTILAYRTLVLQRSPAASRPPSPYRLVARYRWWAVWQRPPSTTTPVIAHLALGTGSVPGGVPGCPAVRALAARAGVRELLAAPAPRPLLVAAATGRHPARWSGAAPYLRLAGAGSARIPVRVPATARYRLWLGGSIRAPTTLAVDGRPVGHVDSAVQEAGQYVPFGVARLSAGVHVVTLTRTTPLLRPGVGGPPDFVGPLALSSTARTGPLRSVPAGDAVALCGRAWDWIEAVR